MIRNVPESRRVTGVGLTMGVSVGLFAYGGLWLDEQFGTKPWLLLLCVIAGIVGSILHMIHVLVPEMWPWPTDAEKAARLQKAELRKAASFLKADSRGSQKSSHKNSQNDAPVNAEETDRKPTGTSPEGNEE
ncbi:MAG: hypothetical protein ACI9S9_000852 [Planctomycetota bacterium]